jgi:hypothetical protein
VDNFLRKLKDLNNEVKLIFFSLLGGIILWFFNLICGTFFSNILFSIFFIITPLISKYIFEIVKSNPKFEELSLGNDELKNKLIFLAIMAVLSFFVFIAFSGFAYKNTNTFGKAIVFGFFGIIFVLILYFSIYFIDKILLFKDHKYLNISINGMIIYFFVILILKTIFDQNLFSGRGFQRFIYLIIESIGSGTVFSLVWYFTLKIEAIDEYIDSLLKYKLKIEKVESSKDDKEN